MSHTNFTVHRPEQRIFLSGELGLRESGVDVRKASMRRSVFKADTVTYSRTSEGFENR